jgi:hypothetical protein
MKKTASRLIIGAMLFALLSTFARADDGAEFLLFLSADGVERNSIGDAALESSDFTPTVDLLFGYNNGPWRFLGEYLLTDDESELERLQLGYDFSPDSTVWFGRYHQPTSAWNHRYHHGAYLQPSISRPSVENWEDDGGVIPSHITGLMLDGWQPLGDSNGLRYAISAGFAPTFENEALLPFDFLDPGNGASRLAGGINIAYYPDYVGGSNAGLIMSFTQIEAPPSATLGTTTVLEIRQKMFGAQVNWENSHWELISAVYYVENKSHGASLAVDGSFASAYVQALRSLTENTSAFVRLEGTHNEDAEYLRLFPGYVYERQLAGFRWDFAPKQALALEISSNKVIGERFNEYRLQWSTVFPQ